jgi:hypothetical protein
MKHDIACQVDKHFPVFFQETYCAFDASTENFTMDHVRHSETKICSSFGSAWIGDA